MQGRLVIRSLRKGSVQWNEEDRLQLAQLLVKAGYAVTIKRRQLAGEKKNAQFEYTVEAWEDKDGISQ